MVNPNVGAALIVDAGPDSGISNAHLKAYLSSQSADYVLSGLPHRFLSLGQTFEEDLVTGILTPSSVSKAPGLNVFSFTLPGLGIVKSWLDEVNSCQRTPQPLSKLKG
jgi:hypothetical protein